MVKIKWVHDEAHGGRDFKFVPKKYIFCKFDKVFNSSISDRVMIGYNCALIFLEYSLVIYLYV